MLKKLLRIITVSSLLVMVFSTSECQQAMIKKYTINDGLVMNRVRGFHQDNQGFIWIYTWDGLSRFEGYRFRNYVGGEELEHGLINDILEYPDGSIYVAANDSTLEVIKNLEVQKDLTRKTTIVNVFFRDKQGKILTGTDYSGICLFDKGQMKSLSNFPRDVAVHTAVVRNNTIFMGSVLDLIVGKIIYDG